MRNLAGREEARPVERELARRLLDHLERSADTEAAARLKASLAGPTKG